MTDIEAKAIIERDLNCLKQNKALPDSIESMEIAINALEKQIPKKPKEKYCIGFNTLVCPECKMELYLYEPYCDNCGQAIDWSNYE